MLAFTRFYADSIMGVVAHGRSHCLLLVTVMLILSGYDNPWFIYASLV